MGKSKKRREKQQKIIARQMTGACVIFALFVVTMICLWLVIRG